VDPRGVSQLQHRVIASKKFRTTIAPNTNKMSAQTQDAEALIRSDDPHHPANHICTLCAHFYTLGWVC
jgi:hypothetical protein